MNQQARQNSKIQGLLQGSLIAEIYRKDLDQLQLYPQKAEQLLNKSIIARDNRLDKVKVSFSPPNFHNKQILPPSVLCFEIKNIPDVDCSIEKDITTRCKEISDKYKFVVDFLNELQDDKNNEQPNIGEEPHAGEINKQNQPKESKVDKDQREKIANQQRLANNNRIEDKNNSVQNNYFYPQQPVENRPQLYGQLREDKDQGQVNRQGSSNSYFFKNADDNQNNKGNIVNGNAQKNGQAIPNFYNIFHHSKLQDNNFENSELNKNLALIKNDSYESNLQTEEAVKLMQETGLSLEDSIQSIKKHGTFDKAIKYYLDQFNQN